MYYTVCDLSRVKLLISLSASFSLISSLRFIASQHRQDKSLYFLPRILHWTLEVFIRLLLVPPERLELSTPRVKAECSTLLSYGGLLVAGPRLELGVQAYEARVLTDYTIPHLNFNLSCGLLPLYVRPAPVPRRLRRKSFLCQSRTG